VPVCEVGLSTSHLELSTDCVKDYGGRVGEGARPSASCLPAYLCRRDAEAIVCISPVSTLGPSQSPITLAIDHANISNTGVIYTYTQDPTVTHLEPTWSIIK
jgi:hypothetical protein